MTDNLEQNRNDKSRKSIKGENIMTQYGLTSDINPFFCAFGCMHYLDALKYIKATREYYQKLFSNKGTSKTTTTSELNNITDELHYFMNNYKHNLLMNENLINFVLEPLLDKEIILEVSKLFYAEGSDAWFEKSAEEILPKGNFQSYF